ncbi:MAG: COX15/CtaA family protein [Candidatus Dormibacter sp.]|uniref:COX15/CtaA family protein n=1 Tax=Candidatus Dormibacter sp. TaxID=2973982 RepID=UPI000DB502DF|nr:MAG: heme A synthase [Candidatus Dormibacteraeota bacterium]
MNSGRALRSFTGWLGVAASVGMLVVLIMGARVTDTGSAAGCGRDWPLCNGRFIPEFAAATAIEFSHRLVTGVEGFLIVALAVLALLLLRHRRVVLILVPIMLFGLVAQALLGAAAVMWPEQPEVLALHFGISLIALASTTLVALCTLRPDSLVVRQPVPALVATLTWAYAVYIYFLVYSGAYIRHAGAAAACPGWPFCGSGYVAQGSAVGVNYLHRFLAAGALVLALGLWLLYRRYRPDRRDLETGARLTVLATLAQGAAGAFLVLNHWELFGELLHAALTGLLFTGAAYLAFRVSLGYRAAAATSMSEEGGGLRSQPSRG